MTTARLATDPPLTPEETRARLPSPSPCHPDCPGWVVSESSLYGMRVECCDECWRGAPDDVRVYDDDVRQLPEAQARLREISRFQDWKDGL